jgi:hypothetical protein
MRTISKAREIFRRFFGARRRLEAHFESEYAKTLKTVTDLKPFSKWAMQEVGQVRNQLLNAPSRLQKDLSDSRRRGRPSSRGKTRRTQTDVFDTTLKELERLKSRLSSINARDTAWLDKVMSISQTVNDLWIASSAFPGKEFAKEADTRKRQIDLLLSSVARTTPAQKVDEKIASADKQAGSFRALVDQARELIEGYPILSEAIDAIDKMSVEQDVACSQMYETLQRMRKDIASAIAKNSYAMGHRTLLSARKTRESICQDIRMRHDLARAEIDLWVSDPEICARFNLQSVPRQLTAEQAQRWLEIRIEIAEIVEARAEGTRKNYAKRNPKIAVLGKSLKELGKSPDQNLLEAFARATVRLSNT